MTARLVFVVVSAALVTAPACASSDILDRLRTGDVRVAVSLSEIDPGALAAVKRAFSYDHRMADRDAPFNAADVRSGGHPPSRRLVLAAASGDAWFIHYEHGGRGLHSHLVTVVRSGQSWRIVHTATTFRSYDTLSKLRAAIRAGQFGEATGEL